MSLPPSLRELVEKQQRTSKEADVERGQINRACQGTVPALNSIVEGISCHTQCVTLNPPVPFILALLQVSIIQPSLEVRRKSFPGQERKARIRLLAPARYAWLIVTLPLR